MSKKKRLKKMEQDIEAMKKEVRKMKARQIMPEVLKEEGYISLHPPRLSKVYSRTTGDVQPREDYTT